MRLVQTNISIAPIICNDVLPFGSSGIFGGQRISKTLRRASRIWFVTVHVH